MIVFSLSLNSGVYQYCFMQILDELKSRIVLDNGTQSIKAGFAGNDSPNQQIPSVLGDPKYHQMMGIQYKTYFGQEAIAKKGILELRKPVEFGIINQWDSMIKLWSHIFQQRLKVNTSQVGATITEIPNNFKLNRQKIAEAIFQCFNMPQLFLINTATVALFANGKTTGIVADSGQGITNFSPIIQGRIVSKSVVRLDLSGYSVTNYLFNILQQVRNFYSFDIAKNVKQKICYVACDYEEELKKSQQKQSHKEYELPDGCTFSLSNQTFKCVQIMFKPHIIGKSLLGFTDCLDLSINRCEKQTWGQMYKNIVLAGGNTLFKGFPERIKSQLVKRVQNNTKIAINAMPQRKHLSWIGGSIISQMSSFSCQEHGVSKQQYKQHGPTIVHKKCPV